MKNHFVKSSTLIITEEKSAIMNPVLNLLQKDGYAVIKMENQRQPAFVSQVQKGSEITEFMDGPTILRFIRENWEKAVPVIFFQPERGGSAVFQPSMLAA